MLRLVRVKVVLMLSVVILLISLMLATVVMIQLVCSHWMPVKRLIVSLVVLVATPICIMLAV